MQELPLKLHTMLFSVLNMDNISNKILNYFPIPRHFGSFLFLPMTTIKILTKKKQQTHKYIDFCLCNLFVSHVHMCLWCVVWDSFTYKHRTKKKKIIKQKAIFFLLQLVITKRKTQEYRAMSSQNKKTVMFQPLLVQTFILFFIFF